MDIVLLSVSPVPLRLLIGLLILLAGVLTIFWLFMAKNNPKSHKVDSLPENNEANKLQDRYDKGEISEEDYRRRLQEMDDERKSR